MINKRDAIRQHPSPYTHKYSSFINKGGKYILVTSFKAIIIIPISFLIFKLFLRFRKFTFQDKIFAYSTHWYNRTWLCERTIEIPIFVSLLKHYDHSSILEVGNVISHYISIHHDIVDKYEASKSVINQDIMEFQTDRKYQIIITISTLEHIGMDEEHFKPEKAIAALIKLQSLLTHDGEIHLSVPIGYNLTLDKYLLENFHIFKRASLMKRVSRLNMWAEEKYPLKGKVHYGYPYPFANVILIGVIGAKTILESPPHPTSDI